MCIRKAAESEVIPEFVDDDNEEIDVPRSTINTGTASKSTQI